MIFALVALVVLLITGISLGELRVSSAVVCLAIVGSGFPLFYFLDWELAAYMAVLAVIDIILVLVIFKSDLRIH
jgi:hypothetical protein